MAASTAVVESADTGTTNSGSSSVTSLAVPKASNIAYGDVLILVVGVKGNRTMTGPGGAWTEGYDKYSSFSNCTLSMYYTRAGDGWDYEGESDATVTFSASGRAAGFMLRVSGVDEALGIFDQIKAAANQGTGTVHNPGTFVASEDDVLCVCVGVFDGGDDAAVLGGSTDPDWTTLTTYRTGTTSADTMVWWVPRDNAVNIGDGTQPVEIITAVSDGSVQGVFGMVGGTPPSAPVPPSAKRGSGIAARGLTTGNDARWLLEVDLGAEKIRVATHPCAVESREHGDVVRFDGGLSEITSDVTIDRASLQVRARPRASWAAYRRDHGPIRGRPARLWRWYEGLVLEDSYLILEGTIDAASFGDPGSPDTLDITVSRDAEGLSAPWPSLEAVVTTDTWSQDSGRYIDEGIVGQNYPTIIGAPGNSGDAGSGARPFLGSPALFVKKTTLVDTLVVAGHHVSASAVFLWNNTQGDSITAEAVENTFDDQGNPVAVCYPRGNWLAATDLNPEDEVYVGWSRTSTYGVGLTFEGRAVSGLGDLLLWGATTLSRAAWDFAEMRAQREALNVLHVDTYWNQPMTWEAWVQSNILRDYPVLEVQGPNGRYYRRIVWEADARHIQAQLATAGSGSGRRVQRVAAITEDGRDITNVLEVDYGARPTSGVARRKLVLGPTPGKIPGPPSGAQITTTSGDAVAATSATYYGPRYQHVTVPTTWSSATAAVIARYKMSAALPGRRTRYRGGVGLLDLYEYATIRLYDTADGVAIDGELAIVERIRITSAGVELDVYIPDNPRI